MRTLFIALLAAVLLSSCSAERRLYRLLKNNPELVATDTSFQLDTIFTPSASLTDTFYLDTGEHDTLISENDTVRTVVIRWRDRIITRTTVKRVPVTVETRIITKSIVAAKPKGILGISRFSGWWWLYVLLCFGSFGFAVIAIMAWARKR